MRTVQYDTFYSVEVLEIFSANSTLPLQNYESTAAVEEYSDTTGF